jgi:DNA invertase Pin-like site-specific DNA recombinase
MNKMYGYIRVSTREQNDNRQRAALENFGVSPQNFFVDKQSGKDFARPQYRRLLKKIKAGDVLIVKSIDRLGKQEKLLVQHITHSLNGCVQKKFNHC